MHQWRQSLEFEAGPKEFHDDSITEIQTLSWRVAYLERELCELQSQACNFTTKDIGSHDEVAFLRSLATSGNTDREAIHRVEVKLADMAGHAEGTPASFQLQRSPKIPKVSGICYGW